MSETASWFAGWSVADESLTGSNTVTLPYKNAQASSSSVLTTGDQTIDGSKTFLKPIIMHENNKIQFWNSWISADETLLTIAANDEMAVKTNHIDFDTFEGFQFKLENNPSAMVMRFDGNLGLGVATPQNKLDVNGTVHAKEVKVDMVGWADLVFKKEYALPTLDEVEKNIIENGHLSNVPSEKEVLEKGIKLGEMNKILLQKIEELTLYSIEQNKQNKKLQLRLDKVEKLLSEKNIK